jgi:hypothetical protein
MLGVSVLLRSHFSYFQCCSLAGKGVCVTERHEGTVALVASVAVKLMMIRNEHWHERHCGGSRSVLLCHVLPRRQANDLHDAMQLVLFIFTCSVPYNGYQRTH